MSHDQAIGQANDGREVDQADLGHDCPEAFDNDEPITETEIHSHRGRPLRRNLYLKDYTII